MHDFSGGCKESQGRCKTISGRVRTSPQNVAVACSVCKGQTGSTLLTCERGGDIIVQMQEQRELNPSQKSEQNRH